MSENYNGIEEMTRAQEARGGTCLSSQAAEVRKAVKSALHKLGLKNPIDDVRWDNVCWQVNLGGTVSKEERTKIQEMTAERSNFGTERIKLVAIYWKEG